MRSINWQMAFVEWCKNLEKFSTVIWGNSAVSELVKLNGNFFSDRCSPVNFRLAHQVWRNRPLV